MMKGKLNKRFFRPDEVAQLLAISRRTVYRMMLDGRLPRSKSGSGSWRIPREGLEAILPAAGLTLGEAKP